MPRKVSNKNDETSLKKSDVNAVKSRNTLVGNAPQLFKIDIANINRTPYIYHVSPVETPRNMGEVWTIRSHSSKRCSNGTFLTSQNAVSHIKKRGENCTIAIHTRTGNVKQIIVCDGK